MAVKITTPEGIITFYNTHVSRERERSTPLFYLFPPPDQWNALPRKSAV
ncbi:MAG: hypothetical protein MJE68_19955 [Proteobacteria bacterium]|nr:hypothetical protein [Pseudomonadota bacterium]